MPHLFEIVQLKHYKIEIHKQTCMQLDKSGIKECQKNIKYETEIFMKLNPNYQNVMP